MAVLQTIAGKYSDGIAVLFRLTCASTDTWISRNQTLPYMPADSSEVQISTEGRFNTILDKRTNSHP